jgi:protoporphyrinogen oxidase
MRLTKNWRALEKTTVVEWMKKWAGKNVYEEMWEPMLIGKFGPYHQEVNMAWFWARMHARTTRLGTYVGGFQAFSDAFAEKLRERGVQMKLSTPLEGITEAPEGGLNLSYTGQTHQYDQCLVTTSPGLLAKFAPELSEAYLKELLKLKSMGAVVMVLSLKEQFSKEGYYWYNIPKSAGFPFLSVVEHTNFVSKDHFNGEHILYIGDYLDQDHEYFSLSKEELLERFIPSLSRINPNFKPEWINKTWLFSSKYAQPIPLINHSKNIPAIKTPIDGLYFASMSQVYPWDRGTNFAVQKAREAAQLMLSNSR